jgi:hypothetical protein
VRVRLAVLVRATQPFQQPEVIFEEILPLIDIIPSPIQYFLRCNMTVGAPSDRGLMVSNIRHLMREGRTVPAAFGTRSPVPMVLAEAPPYATAWSTSTIENRSVISVTNSSR